MAFGKLPGSGEIEAMSIRTARAVFKAWERFPPPHRCAAVLLSTQTTWKPEERGRKTTDFRESSPSELAAFAGAAGLRILSNQK